MSVKPFSWNVIVVGAWNKAILTPDGIRRRLFDLPDGTPVEVEIAIDVPGPYKVGHNGILVAPATNRLEVAMRHSDVASLERACIVCSRALRSLPETPVSAAGINVKYKFTELPDPLFDLIQAPALDGALSDAGLQVKTSEIKRGIVVPPGIVNLKVAHTGGEGALEFNFHRESREPTELIAWLERSAEFVQFSDKLATVIGVADVRREIINA